MLFQFADGIDADAFVPHQDVAQTKNERLTISRDTTPQNSYQRRA